MLTWRTTVERELKEKEIRIWVKRASARVDRRARGKKPPPDSPLGEGTSDNNDSV